MNTQFSILDPPRPPDPIMSTTPLPPPHSRTPPPPFPPLCGWPPTQKWQTAAANIETHLELTQVDYSVSCNRQAHPYGDKKKKTQINPLTYQVSIYISAEKNAETINKGISERKKGVPTPNRITPHHPALPRSEPTHENKQHVWYIATIR